MNGETLWCPSFVGSPWPLASTDTQTNSTHLRVHVQRKYINIAIKSRNYRRTEAGPSRGGQGDKLPLRSQDSRDLITPNASTS